jgi:hypothetical protein
MVHYTLATWHGKNVCMGFMAVVKLTAMLDGRLHSLMLVLMVCE